MFTSPQTDQLLPQDEAARLGVTADAHDQYDLMRAITRCDELISRLRAMQMIHSQNLCRRANHLAADLATEEAMSGRALNVIAVTLRSTFPPDRALDTIRTAVQDTGRDAGAHQQASAGS